MKRFSAALALVLALVIGLTPGAAAVESAVLYDADGDADEYGLDYSVPYTHRAVISAGNLLAGLLTRINGSYTSIPQAEREYLNRYFDEYLIYSDVLPGELVELTAIEDGWLVSARPHTVSGTNGRTLTHLPVSVTCNGNTAPMTLAADGTAYEALLPLSDPVEVTVNYSSAAILPADAVNRLLNYAFREASAAAASDQALASYTAALADYRAYLTALADYQAQVGQYGDYLAAKALYDAALADYERNLAERAAYEEQRSAYEAYRARYNDYRTKLEQYRAEYALYEARQAAYLSYLTDLRAARAAMLPLESLFLSGSKTGNLYNALQNAELVVMFEKYQDLLVSGFGVAQSDIQQLREGSDRLNELLRGYAAARELSEERAFGYYQANYAEITSLFTMLYDKMNSIFTPTIYNLMCGKIELEYDEDFATYRKWRIKNVLCHIYLICLCLDDSRVAENTWRFYADTGDPHTYYFSDLLDQTLIITDTGASDPSALVWPAPVEQMAAPTLPVEPTPMTEPIPPAVLPEPVAPEVVSEPVAPEAVAEPILPHDVDHALLERTAEIQGALSNGQLTQRREVAEDVSLPLGTLTVTRRASLNETPTVTAFGADGSILSVSSPEEPLPTVVESYEDESFTYVFRGWSVCPDRLVALPETVTESLCAYALYEASPKRYTVTFRVGEETVCGEVPFGEIPVFPGVSAERESDERYHYTFSTWSPALRPAREDATYTAEYIATERLYTVTFELHGQTLSRQYSYGETPVCSVLPVSYLEGASLYEFEGWDAPLRAVDGDAVYRAVYHETPLAGLSEQEGGAVTVTETATGYLLTTSGLHTEIGPLLERAVAENKTLEIRFSSCGATLTPDREALTELGRQGVSAVLLLWEEGDGGRGIGVRFADAAGEQKSPKGELRLRIPHPYDRDTGVGLRATFETGAYDENTVCRVSDGTVELLARADAWYKPIRRFTLTVISGENGHAYAEHARFTEGQEIALSLHPDAEYRVGRLTLTDPVTGASRVLSAEESPIMPAYDATLTVEFEPITYSVTFRYNGSSSTERYRLGEEVVIPQIATSFEADGFYYTFTGWSEPIGLVTGDMTYTAKYYSVRLDLARDDGGGGAWGVILRRYGSPVAATLLAAVAVTATAVAVKKRRKKKNGEGATVLDQQVKKHKGKG